MAHRKEITTEIDGRIINIPTVINGRQLTEDEAVRIEFGRLRRGGRHRAPFSSTAEAVAASKRRSGAGKEPKGTEARARLREAGKREFAGSETRLESIAPK